MDFGKLANIERVDFSLPEDSERSLETLRRAKERRFEKVQVRTRVFFGAPLWAKKEWVGKLYPEGARSQDFLKHYSRQLSAIELNTTFYRIPDLKTIDAWRQITPEGFRFCPKFYQEISHGSGMRYSGALIRGFCEASLLLGDRLGTTFLQLGPSFSPANLADLGIFLRQLPSAFPIAVEFRHPHWFSRGNLIEEARELLAGSGAATVITDVAGRRDVSHATLTAPRLMVRFVGNGLHRSDYARIDAWVERLGRWIEHGLEEIYFFVHQPDEVLCPELISYFVEKMNARSGLGLKDWDRQEQQLSFLN